MFFITKKPRTASETTQYFIKNLAIVVGLVLIWRGIWYVLDYLDLIFLNNNHLPSSIGGIILGLAILYLPDKNLNEISKL